MKYKYWLWVVFFLLFILTAFLCFPPVPPANAQPDRSYGKGITYGPNGGVSSEYYHQLINDTTDSITTEYYDIYLDNTVSIDGSLVMGITAATLTAGSRDTLLLRIRYRYFLHSLPENLFHPTTVTLVDFSDTLASLNDCVLVGDTMFFLFKTPGALGDSAYVDVDSTPLGVPIPAPWVRFFIDWPNDAYVQTYIPNNGIPGSARNFQSNLDTFKITFIGSMQDTTHSTSVSGFNPGPP